MEHLLATIPRKWRGARLGAVEARWSFFETGWIGLHVRTPDQSGHLQTWVALQSKTPQGRRYSGRKIPPLLFAPTG